MLDIKHNNRRPLGVSNQIVIIDTNRTNRKHTHNHQHTRQHNRQPKGRNQPRENFQIFKHFCHSLSFSAISYSHSKQYVQKRQPLEHQNRGVSPQTPETFEIL
jgi:hypothetical protein